MSCAGRACWTKDVERRLHPWIARGLLLVLFAMIITLVHGQGRQNSAPQDIKAYQEAMGWFKKAEAMIGTPKENSDEQADLFRKAISIKPDFMEAHFNLGLIDIHQKKFQAAVDEFGVVQKLNPDFEANGESIYQLLALVHQELGQNAEAIAALQEGVKRRPKDLRTLKALAFFQVHGTADTDAIPALQAILEIDPKDADARINLGILLQKLDRLDEAAQSYRLALELNPTDFNAHFNLALLLLRQDKIADAGVELEAADRISPGNGEVLERLGDAYSYQDRLEKAAQAYQAAVGKLPERAVLLSKLAFTLARLKRVPEAIPVLEKSVSLDARSADAFFLLGDLYSDQKRYDESLVAYNKSLKLNPKQKEVHYNMGTIFAESKRYREARTELRAAIDIDPNYAAAWSNLAMVCERLDLDKDAIEANEKVVALGKALATNYFRLGILYAKGNLPDPAIANFAKAIQMEPEKYRQILREELKNVHSVLDSVRYKDAFIRLLNGGPPTSR
jgi:tetratricopeptide (TPR) repeat protein